VTPDVGSKVGRLDEIGIDITFPRAILLRADEVIE